MVRLTCFCNKRINKLTHPAVAFIVFLMIADEDLSAEAL